MLVKAESNSLVRSKLHQLKVVCYFFNKLAVYIPIIYGKKSSGSIPCGYKLIFRGSLGGCSGGG